MKELKPLNRKTFYKKRLERLHKTFMHILKITMKLCSQMHASSETINCKFPFELNCRNV